MFFFFNDTATTEIYTLSLHDALPISLAEWLRDRGIAAFVLKYRLAREKGSPYTIQDHAMADTRRAIRLVRRDRKITRLNSSHANISYAVFCLKKKKNQRVRLLPDWLR